MFINVFLIFYVKCMCNSINERLHFCVFHILVPSGVTVEREKNDRERKRERERERKKKRERL